MKALKYLPFSMLSKSLTNEISRNYQFDLQKDFRGHTELNHGPLDLQSNALPLSYIPMRCMLETFLFAFAVTLIKTNAKLHYIQWPETV